LGPNNWWGYTIHATFDASAMFKARREYG